MILFFNQHFNSSAPVLEFKRGDALTLELVFLDAAGRPQQPELDAVIFGAKRKSDYRGDFVARAEGFAAGTTAEGVPHLAAPLSLDGLVLSELLGGRESVTLTGEFEFRTLAGVLSSQTLDVIVHNDVIKGLEGADPATAPDYATKNYVDNVVRDHIDTETIAELREISESAKTTAESNAQTLDEAKEAGQAAVSSAASAQASAAEAAQSRSYAATSREESAKSATTANEKAGEAATSAEKAKQAVETLGAFVRSLGGKSGDFLLGNGLRLVIDTTDGAERVTLETARNLSVESLTANGVVNFNNLARCTSSFQMLGDLQFNRGATGYISVVSDSAGSVFWIWNDTQNNANSTIFFCNKDHIILDKRLLARVSPIMATGLDYQAEGYAGFVTSNIAKDGTLTFSAGATGNIVFNLPVSFKRGLFNIDGRYCTLAGGVVRIGDTTGVPNTQYLEFSNNTTTGAILSVYQYNPSGVLGKANIYIPRLVVDSGAFTVRAGVPSIVDGSLTANGNVSVNGAISLNNEISCKGLLSINNYIVWGTDASIPYLIIAKGNDSGITFMRGLAYSGSEKARVTFSATTRAIFEGDAIFKGLIKFETIAKANAGISFETSNQAYPYTVVVPDKDGIVVGKGGQSTSENKTSIRFDAGTKVNLGGEATRATKESPAETDLMNKAMTEALLNQFADEYGLTKPQ